MTVPRPLASPPVAAGTAGPAVPPSTSPLVKRRTPTASPSTDQPRRPGRPAANCRPGRAPACGTVAAMDETDPVARAQHQLRDDLELVQRYGREEAADQFVGCYWANKPPDTSVALF